MRHNKMATGMDAWSLGIDKCSLGMDKKSLGIDKCSMKTDKHSLGTDKYRLGTDLRSLRNTSTSLWVHDNCEKPPRRFSEKALGRKKLNGSIQAYCGACAKKKGETRQQFNFYMYKK